MSANIFGERFRILSFGESHGPALGVVIDGCPAGLDVDEALLRWELDRRRPGQSALTTSRNEPDAPEILSGVYEGKTLGTPIAVIVRNTDTRSQDYANIATQPRAGHADDVWKDKFGHSDPRGGGRSSGRETLTRVIGGAFARMLVQKSFPDILVKGFTSAVGEVALTPDDRALIAGSVIDSFPARFPSKQATQIERKILAAREAGDSLGGSAEIWIDGVPKGWGQPVFHKLKADFASAYLSVGASSGVEFGAGSQARFQAGTEFHADAMSPHYGGIRGGISTGERMTWTVHFKPTSSILDVAKKGRHDPFIVTRAVPVLEAMTWLVLADHMLWAKTDK